MKIGNIYKFSYNSKVYLYKLIEQGHFNVNYIIHNFKTEPIGKSIPYIFDEDKDMFTLDSSVYKYSIDLGNNEKLIKILYGNIK